MNITNASSRSVLFQVLLFFVAIAILLLMQKNALYALYLSGDVGQLGIGLNGLILVLFLFGLFRIVFVLLSYAREQEVLNKLVTNLRNGIAQPSSELPESSMAKKRYEQIRWINQHNAPVNQAALAASLNASEGSRLTLIRFVHNILILTGVFGTVVSLSIALVGASGLLDSPDGAKNMSTIIGGMSTALSTTITAIICFIVYAYFFLRLNDVKSRLLSSVEDVTSLYILPKITHTEQSLIRDVAKLTVALRQAAERMGEVEANFVTAGDNLLTVVNTMQVQVDTIGSDMREIKQSIRDGFRLPLPPAGKEGSPL
ncbi:MAG: MotA/TolQ/ExbB proton channel family protein [Thiotrichaceae bacterium]|nr:MotA/TolQ/ExbB proton channel family protein [Thiotrichaceae bacterium]